NDFANVIDPYSAHSLEVWCAQVELEAGARMTVVTVRSLDGTSIESYAAKLFNEWGIEPESTNRGVLILLAVEEGQYRIQVGTGLEAILSPKTRDYMNEAAPFLNHRQYTTALELMTQRVASAIAAQAGARLKLPEDALAAQWAPTVQPYDVLVGAVTVMVSFGILVLAVVVTLKAVRKPGRATVKSLDILN